MKRCPRCGSPGGLVNCQTCHAQYLTNPLQLGDKNMGMFDSDLGKIWGEHFKEDQKFTLEGAKLGPVIPTDFGQTQTVLLKINGERFSIMGTGIVNQVKSMQPDDLPADVKII